MEMPELFHVGAPYTGPVPPGEGAVMALRDDGAILVIVSIGTPHPDEALALRGRWEWRLFEGPEMPGGLLMFCGRLPGGDPLIFELSFDATLEASQRLEAVLKRVANPESKEHPGMGPSLMAFVVDPNNGNKIVAIKAIGPPGSLVERLAVLWAQHPGQGDYAQAYQAVSNRYCLEELWELAEAYA